MQAQPIISGRDLTRPQSNQRHPTYAVVILVVLMVAVAILRWHGIAQKSFWTDEGTSIELVRLDWYNFLRILWRREGNMSLYYLLLRAWAHFGNSEAFIRSLSIVPALMTLPALYALGRRMFSPAVGLIAAVLLTVNAYHVRYSQEARSYTLYVFLCVLSSLYFVEFLQEQSRRARVLHVVTSALVVYAHFFAGLLIVVQWISLRFLDDRELEIKMKRNWRDIGIAVLPAIIFVATTGTGLLSWISRPGVNALKSAALEITGNGGWWLVLAYAIACASALLPIRSEGVPPAVVGGSSPPLVTSRSRLHSRQDAGATDAWPYRFLLLWLLFPPGLMFVISQVKPLFLPRYFILVLPALALLAAVGIDRLRLQVGSPQRSRARMPAPHWLVAAVLVVFVALSLRGDLAYYRKDFDIAREDWRGATQFVLSNAQPGDVIIFHQPMGRMPYEYYRGLDGDPAFPVAIYPRHADRLTYKDFFAGRPPEVFLDDVERQYGRVWVVLSHNETHAGVDPTTRFLDSRFARGYESVQVTNFPQIEVSMYRR